MSDAQHTQDEGSGVKIPPPLIYLGVFVIGAGLSLVLPVAEMPKLPLRMLAGVLVILWLVFDLGSMLVFHRAKTGIAPAQPVTQLVTWGPYRYTRNPMYLGMLCLYLAASIWFNLLWALLFLPLLIWLISRYVIAKEEEYMERKFGEDYRQYREKVRRWI
ncbi:MAG: isoprenylcysteine carboxylmethyltransferase family protein [Ectothiorhodospiraceae bacterium]|nr:isoprenylcysteine carboxylmethyltransferase family protein [Ectothiorhodospiraceae bacterium]